MCTFTESIEQNPLLRDIPIEISRQDWWQKLAQDPFFGTDPRSLSPMKRDLLLDRFGDLYVPTAALVEVAYRIHRMLISGLIDRNPHLEEPRKDVYRLASFAQQGWLDTPCISPSTRGMKLFGITKQGKTRLIKRVLAQYRQVIQRARDAAAGWHELHQLVYLVIPMPTDASKAGFLMQAFIELDKALGTTYATDTVIRNSSIDAQLVQFLAKLATHRCGLLIIEEAQESNAMAKNRFGRDFGTFFLRVLNSGIPTVLMGNPLAFKELDTNAQLMSRLSDPGAYELRPCNSPTSSEWREDLVPGIWGKSILPEPDDPIDDLDNKLFKWTGGFKHYLSVLRRETLRSAIGRDADFVDEKDVHNALRTPVMLEGKKIIESYWSGRSDGETSYIDIPGPLSADAQLATSRRRAKQR